MSNRRRSGAGAPTKRRSLISMSDLDRPGIARILRTARHLATVMDRDIKKVPTLRGRTVINLFLEPSTRTSTSFELAAKRLSADVVSIKGSGSSLEKGESLKDTILTLNAYDPDVLVIRHSGIGACHLADRFTRAAVLNAGDGKREHPSQALLDLYTIEREVGPIDGLHVAFVGDVAHSRVARSGIVGFKAMGAHVTLVGPPALIPREAGEALGVQTDTDIRAIESADVVYVLRMQRERMGAGGFVPSVREYASRYMVGRERLRPGQRVMHAGPINRGVELSSEVADDPGTLIEQQAANGLVVRMAILHDLLGEAADEAAPEIAAPEVLATVGV